MAELKERETLVFNNEKQAREFKERVIERVEKKQEATVSRDTVGEQLEDEFIAEGEATQSIKEPWEHTQEEHVEAQQLVDIAFAQDLPAALKKARQSKYYPRNIDLLHDVMTNELYPLVQEQKINKQKFFGWSLLTVIVLLIVILVIMLLFVIT